MLMPKPAFVSSPTSISTRSTEWPVLRVLMVRGCEMEMMPTTRFTVMVCGVMERRYAALGMSLRSARWLDVSLERTRSWSSA